MKENKDPNGNRRRQHSPTNSMRDQLYAVSNRIWQEKRRRLTLPGGFSFNRAGIKNFSPVLSFFDWSLRDCPVDIDFTTCSSANYQALSLLIPYCWHLKQNGCTVNFILDKNSDQGASKMWALMGAQGLFAVSTDPNQNFKSTDVKPLLAIRNSEDFKTGLNRADAYVEKFGIEYQKTLRYLLSELLYNALEHGQKNFNWRGRIFPTPAVMQFTWYEQANEIHFLVADIGMGIKSHLSQTYPAISSDDEALRLAIQPKISGTFGKQNPYSNRNNAGMGLFLSSNIVRRLRSDMYLVSGDSLLHVSPSDLTSTALGAKWPGTFALIAVKLDQSDQFALDQMMQQFRDQAKEEVQARSSIFADERHYLSMYNYFGKNADEKQAAIRHRDHYLLPAVEAGKLIVIDFEHVTASTHSFLNALLASPIRRMGLAAYKRIKIVNADPSIRETLDYVLDDNTSPEGPTAEKYDDQRQLDLGSAESTE
jgi:hypothetical protein